MQREYVFNVFWPFFVASSPTQNDFWKGPLFVFLSITDEVLEWIGKLNSQGGKKQCSRLQYPEQLWEESSVLCFKKKSTRKPFFTLIISGSSHWFDKKC